jgi:uncharacterized surface protein with fasciclin (FAS1) repeats
MTMRASFARAGAIALPLGLAVSAAQAANLVDVAGKMDQLGTFSDAIAAAGLEDKLTGEGPFTIFAPTDQAFQQLPQPILSKLLEEGQQGELAKLLQYHVVEGKAVTAKDVGQETTVDTMADDQLKIEGGGSTLVLIPSGAEGAQAARTEITAGSDMPATQHQEQVLRTKPEEETRQTAPQGGDMPATQHQEEVLAQGEQPSQAGQALTREAKVVEADVQADNGVIHVIDAVLVPQELSAELARLKGGA